MRFSSFRKLYFALQMSLLKYAYMHSQLVRDCELSRAQRVVSLGEGAVTAASRSLHSQVVVIVFVPLI